MHHLLRFSLFSCLLGQFLFAQPLAERSYPHTPEGWWTFLPDAKPTVAEVDENRGKWLGLAATHRFESQGITYDEQGFAHHRWQLQYRGWPVEHARLFLHARQGKVEKMNGFLPIFSDPAAQPQLTPSQAINLALAVVGAQEYLWENEALLTTLRQVRQDPDFDPKDRAFYYVRVLEIPKPRWTAYDAKYFNLKDLPEDLPMSVQDRAYTSPIWYTP